MEGKENLGFQNDELPSNRESPPSYEESKKQECEVQDATSKERDQWSSPVEFILSCIAMSVGLGNVWRFPATAMDNGGGAFLIPYLTVLLLIGRPLYYMELCMGQFASYGCVKVWSMVPAMKGIGYCQVVTTWAVVTYYVSLMAISLFYFCASFSWELPWTKCPLEDSNCFDKSTNTSIVNSSTQVSASEAYYMDRVTKTHKNGLDDGIFPPDWQLTICLFVSWAILFAIISKGVRSSGKAAYFTALFPYFVLFGLLAKGLTLPGSIKGIKYFFYPDFSKILELNVWKAAVGQCFFSLSVGFGSITMLASYNDFRHNVYRDALIISVTDTLTSILAGATTFSILGYLSEQMGLENVSDVLKGGGTTLAFVTYPDVITHLGWYPQIFACFFFLMLFTLGMGSATALTAVVITVICDAFPKLNRMKLTLLVCILGFLLGIIYVTPQGQFILVLVDSYLCEDVIYIITIAEVISVNWLYGFKNFSRDIEFMLGIKVGIYWKFCWLFFIPTALTGILIYSFIRRTPLRKGSYVFGPVSNGLAISLAVISLLVVPLFIILAYKKRRSQQSSKSKTLKSIFLKPSPKWGPQDEKAKALYVETLKSNNEKIDFVGTYKKTDELVTVSTITAQYKDLSKDEEHKFY